MPAKIRVLLAKSPSGIGRLANVTAVHVDDYPTATHFTLHEDKKEKRQLSVKRPIVDRVAILFLEPRESCEVVLYDAQGNIVGRETVVTEERVDVEIKAPAAEMGEIGVALGHMPDAPKR